MAFFTCQLTVMAVLFLPVALTTPLDDFVYSDESLSQFEFYPIPEYDMDGVCLPDSEVTWHGYVLNVTSGLWLTGKLRR